MAGIPVNANDVNYRVGNLTIQLRNLLSEARTVKRWFDDRSDPDVARIIGNVAASVPDENIDEGLLDDANKLRTVVGALDKLARIATAQEVQPVADDFFFHGRSVIGLA